MPMENKNPVAYMCNLKFKKKGSFRCMVSMISMGLYGMLHIVLTYTMCIGSLGIIHDRTPD